MASIRIPKFGEKLKVLEVSGKKRLNQQAIAKRLDVAESRVSDWKREGDMVPDRHLPGLDKILVSEAHVELSEEQARALWLGDIKDFKAAFNVVLHIQLHDVLLSNPDRIKIAFHDHSIACFGLDEEALDLGDDPIEVCDGTRFRLSAQCNPARRLLVLSWFDSGWRVLAPGTLHSGSIDASGSIVFPEQKMLEFRRNYGIRRYVFIEHDANFLPNLPSSGSGEALRPDVVSQFARRLQMAQSDRKWSWGQAVLKPESASPSIQAAVSTESVKTEPVKKKPVKAKPVKTRKDGK